MRREEKKFIPVEPPPRDEIERAAEVLSKQHLSMYQHLYAAGLTSPGGRPFSVKRFVPSCAGTSMIFVITYHQSVVDGPEYEFTTEDPHDAVIKAKMIYEAASSGTRRVSRRACCPLATVRPCVCVESFDCPIHGRMCIGSHD